MEGLPQGWHTFVGEDGTAVSGGERRRIVRSRERSSPPRSSSSSTSRPRTLYSPTASAIVEDALAAADDRLVLLITHRTEGLELVDEVVRMRRGELSRLVARTRDRASPLTLELRGRR